ncbi:chromate resistance protein ChrB domain-containing protein [Teichococcus vastitatis]|uniref:Sulfurtransferase/chromate resistance protein n=1 Tax=Teichococcus vastitatis TaxID=2307076 RepID=A0ABS9W6W4_9PROT|nr:sulfurtransferase/chromate resistance protein [Pseudoroseomonas vastitatis]MCI0754961.1 sulfurtransferase/chromate resistance protein [Pseudoroseomonas vastitatis]
MPAPDTITTAQLTRLVGLPDAPVLLDVRTEEDFAADPRLLPASLRRDARDVTTWASDHAGQHVVVACQRGLKLSQGVAAWLRHGGARAEVLEGGFATWAAEGHLLMHPTRLPERDGQGRTIWVTRSRPKVDRIACPWLIRRFVDSSAVFLFVAPSEVGAVAERFGAAPFDVEGVFWSHRGEGCTFDTMIQEFGLTSEPLLRLAKIVRGADTARPDLVPQAAGLLAASLGLSRMHRDDLAQLAAGMDLYDAFYRWSRDAVTETHNWPAGAGDGGRSMR